MTFGSTIVQFSLACLALLSSLATSIAQDPSGKTKDAASPPGRPGPAGQPVSISISAYLIDVIQIDDVDSTFTVDFFVELRWKDSKLTDPARSEQRRLALSDAWHPELAFVNERNVSPKLQPYLLVEPDGSVRYPQRYLGTFSVALDLREFPFDDQTLSIDMVVLRYRPGEVVFVHDVLCFADLPVLA